MRAVTARAVSALGAVLLLGTLCGCSSDDEPSDVTVVVDGQTHRMTARVVCTRFPDGMVLIYA